MADRHESDIAALRAFNRAYTSRLGFLNAHLDRSPFTLSEARILYEVAHHAGSTAADIARTLNIDRAQISRTLKRFVDRGLLEIYPHATHGRRQLLALTNKGRASFTALDKNTGVAVGKLLAELPQVRRRRLLSAATAISQVLDAVDEVDVRLRGLRPGDLGTVTARQAVLYADEYGWNQDYEGLVARLLAEFQQRYDPTQDAAWIAEIDNSMVGSIFLVRSDEPGVGQLRLLYVEPEARGLGVGKKLVGACIARARELGYEKLNLWTNTVLAAARHIYVGAGFRLIDEAPHQSFGQDLIGQTWSLDLR